MKVNVNYFVLSFFSLQVFLLWDLFTPIVLTKTYVTSSIISFLNPYNSYNNSSQFLRSVRSHWFPKPINIARRIHALPFGSRLFSPRSVAPELTLIPPSSCMFVQLLSLRGSLCYFSCLISFSATTILDQFFITSFIDHCPWSYTELPQSQSFCAAVRSTLTLPIMMLHYHSSSVNP